MKLKIHFLLVSAVWGLLSLAISVQTVGCSDLNQNFVKETVQLATNPAVFNVSPKTVTDYFKGFASLASKEKDNVEWIFTGTGLKKSPLRQIKARFQKDNEEWPLLVIRLEISPTQNVTYEKISGELTRK